MWQKVQAKALFIEQMRRNEVTRRRDRRPQRRRHRRRRRRNQGVGHRRPPLPTTGRAQDDVSRLTALERAHLEAARRRDFTSPPWNARSRPNSATWTRCRPVAARAAAVRGGRRPGLAVGGRHYGGRAAAAEPLAAACRRAYMAGKDRGACGLHRCGVGQRNRDSGRARPRQRCAVAAPGGAVAHHRMEGRFDGRRRRRWRRESARPAKRVENLYSGLPASPGPSGRTDSDSADSTTCWPTRRGLRAQGTHW